MPTQPPDYLSLILTILGTIIVALITAVATAYFTGQQNRKQEWEKARHVYLDGKVEQLIVLRSQLQFLQIALHELVAILSKTDLSDADKRKAIAGKMNDPTYKEMELAFGHAFAIMVSVDVAAVRERASDVMKSLDANVKLEAINFALERLGHEYGFFRPS